MIRPPSTQRAWDEYYSGDPAFVQLAADATEEQKTEHANKWRIARETGNPLALLREGEIPTKFILRPIDGDVWRAFNDRVFLPSDAKRRIGFLTAPGVLLRLALQSVSGLDFVVKRAPDPEWDGWEMAQPDIVRLLDSVDLRIVSELGGVVYDRMNDLPKK